MGHYTSQFLTKHARATSALEVLPLLTVLVHVQYVHVHRMAGSDACCYALLYYYSALYSKYTYAEICVHYR